MNEPVHWDKFVFNYNEWSAQYPVLRGIFTEPESEGIVKRAAIYFNPAWRKVVKCEEERKVLFYLLIAHYVMLEKRIKDGNPLVGAIASVTEGSISLSAVAPSLKNEFFSQTQYGIEFKELTKRYTKAFFVPPIPNPKLRIFP